MVIHLIMKSPWKITVWDSLSYWIKSFSPFNYINLSVMELHLSGILATSFWFAFPIKGSLLSQLSGSYWLQLKVKCQISSFLCQKTCGPIFFLLLTLPWTVFFKSVYLRPLINCPRYWSFLFSIVLMISNFVSIPFLDLNLLSILAIRHILRLASNLALSNFFWPSIIQPTQDFWKHVTT